MTASPRRYARMAGFLYLLLALVGPFSLVYVPMTLMVPGDAAATVANIGASEGLFRAGIASQSILVLTEIALPVILYVLLRPVNPVLALIAMLARLAMAVVQGMNLLNYFFVLLLLSGADYLSALSTGQINALVNLFLDAHEYTGVIWQIFFGFHLILLGYLVFRSGYLPRLLGVALMFASLGYLAESYGAILWPGSGVISASMVVLLGISTVAEIALLFWLLIRAVDVERWNGWAAPAGPL